MKAICECGHAESDHADFGFRRCARRNCPCDQYIEDDDAISWDNDPNGGKILVGLALLVGVIILFIKCLGAPTEAVGLRVRAPIDSAVLDSARAKGCPKGCTCAMDGVITECPDIRPPGVVK